MSNIKKGAERDNPMSTDKIGERSEKPFLGKAAPLDFVDYVSAKVDASSILLKELPNIRKFGAALSAYLSSSVHLTLGYAGFFCWSEVHRSFKISEDHLLDYLRIAAYCNKLSTDDERHIDLDYNLARERFPLLFRMETISFLGPERSSYLASLSAEMGSFAVHHPYRSVGFSQVRASDEDNYIGYWISHSERLLSTYLDNPRFVAGLDAFGQGFLSFHGFLEKVFGLDYYNSVLKENHFALFGDLRNDLTARVLLKLVGDIQQRASATDLRRQFPDIYEFYQPELYGARH